MPGRNAFSNNSTTVAQDLVVAQKRQPNRNWERSNPARRYLIPVNVRDEVAALAEAVMELGRALHLQARFAEAEPLLVEADQLLTGTPYPVPEQRRLCAVWCFDLYTAWDKANPGKGYADKAEHWKARLPSSRPTTSQPTTAPTAR